MGEDSMVVAAVLPPATGWGFNPDLPASISYNLDQSPLSTHKRKRQGDLVDDSDLENIASDIPQHPIDIDISAEALKQIKHSPRKIAKVHKKLRVCSSSYEGRPLPISRQLESLDRDGLISLIQNMCDTHHGLAPLISQAAPRVTTGSALESLTQHLNNIHHNFPYKSDPQGDYAFLRVRPYVEEFVLALMDYTGHFMTLVDSQTPSTLAFLDGATELVHKLPQWSNDANNAQRNNAYSELSQAWMVALRQAVEKSPFALAHGGWQGRLYSHNQLCGGLLSGAVELLHSLV